MCRMLLTLGLGALLFVGCAVETSPTNSPDPTESAQEAPAPGEATETQSLSSSGVKPATFPVGPEVCSQSCPGEACCYGGRNVGWLCC